MPAPEHPGRVPIVLTGLAAQAAQLMDAAGKVPEATTLAALGDDALKAIIEYYGGSIPTV